MEISVYDALDGQFFGLRSLMKPFTSTKSVHRHKRQYADTPTNADVNNATVGIFEPKKEYRQSAINADGNINSVTITRYFIKPKEKFTFRFKE